MHQSPELQPVPLPSAAEVYRFRFHGQGGELFVLLLKNILLTMLTFGIYSAWAKTERRRYTWSHTEVHGNRLVYTGTGNELFVAYLKVCLGYLVLFSIATVVGWIAGKSAQVAVQGLFGFAILGLIPFAVYWSRAYLLSRTQWRGIRFGLVVGAGRYARTFFLGYLATILTLGIYGPFVATELRRQITNNSRFGSQPFHYDGVGREVFWISARGMLLTVCTLGVYYFWWQAELGRYHFAHTCLSGARGRSTLTGGDLFKIFLLNLVVVSLTLGLAFPWVAVWTSRRVLERVSFEGHIDFDAIAQGAAAGAAGGDAMADALDVGLGV
jgi:uncharacterized membrane protein YjgN (DUF898 family)